MFNLATRLRNGERRKKTGRTPTISPQFKRAIFRTVRKSREERVTASTLIAKYDPVVGVRRVQQLLHDSAQACWTRMRPAPRLTQNHRSNRIEWAEKRLNENRNLWHHTIFSDEKRWFLDGPDGNSYHCACKYLDPRLFSKRQRGGRSLMVWGCFSAHGAPQLRFINGNMDLQQYCDILSNVMVPFAESAVIPIFNP